MLVADYIAQYLVEKGSVTSFGYPGGMVTFLMDAFNKSAEISDYALYHEQAAGFAACGYTQVSGKTGIAYATSGPGATNLMTAICHAYYESVPVVFITGQVNTNEAKGALPIRQKGFQEMEVIKMVDNFTKYCAYINNPQEIKYYLDKAFYHANEGRPGPVLLDIPIDVQRTEITVDSLNGFTPNMESEINYQAIVERIVSELNQANRPILLLENGINTAGVASEFKTLVDMLKIPAVSTMIAVDIIKTENDNNFGFIGAYGHRHANFILSQCDLIISFGSRLDIRQTGANIGAFAKNAKLIRVDIDQNEFENKIKADEIDLYADLQNLSKALIKAKIWDKWSVSEKWINQCNYYKKNLSQVDRLYPNIIVEAISELVGDGSVITTDVGQNQVWVSQSFKAKLNQRIIFSGGHGSMGFSLPAAIGAYYASKKPVYCFVGDGGMQMNIQELQFLAREKIPVKIIVLNNHSLGMIRHFQEMYFDAHFTHTVANNGYSNPDFCKIGLAYGIKSYKIENIEELNRYRSEFADFEPVLFDVNVGSTTFVYPKLAFNKPIYDQDPELDRDLLRDLLTYEG